MRKFWLVFIHEYGRHVFRWRFLVMLLSIPGIIVVAIGFSIAGALLTLDRTPVGLVDLTGQIQPPSEASGDDEMLSFNLPVFFYPDEASARAALDQGDIQGYFSVPADYFENGQVDMVAIKPISDNGHDAIEDILVQNITASLPEPEKTRLREGPNFRIQSVETERETSSQNWLNIILPIGMGILFIITINTSGGYLLQAVVEEKENRTIEMIITTVSPLQLMAGKIAGNLSVGLTQLAFWLTLVFVPLSLAASVSPMLQNMELDPAYLTLATLTILPAFILVASIMATLGASATEAREAQQIAGLFTLPIVMPFWFINQIMMNPNGPLAITFSMFPLTAPISLPLRAAFTDLPTWQAVLSIGLLFVLAGVSVWLSGRAFRLGLLRYGKRLSMKELFMPIKTRTEGARK